MARHFLTLYLSIVITLAAVSWGQERLWQCVRRRARTRAMLPQAGVLAVAWPPAADSAERTATRSPVATLRARPGSTSSCWNRRTSPAPARSTPSHAANRVLMDGADGRAWLLQRLEQDGRVLAFRFENEAQRGLPDWLLAFVFYAAIALVIMVWLWPMTRDLRALERSTVRFGDRNWSFDAPIAPRSPVYPLAEAFRRMAARIDGLIGSHKDMSNALSHEIKTPLARMRFEIELARVAADREALQRHLDHLNTDVTELNCVRDRDAGIRGARTRRRWR